MGAQELVLYGLVMSSAGCATISAYPALSRLWGRVGVRVAQFQSAKVERASRELDDIFLEVKPTWLKVAYGVGPITAGLMAYLLSHSTPIALIGAVAGIVVPDLWLRQARAARKRIFQSQLVDALFILSSSLRAGLSLPQAFEQLATEMNPPASQEFGLVVKAHRLGRSLERALEGLNERMRSDELRLVTTAILLARETGGDVTSIIHQLIVTIRDRKKLREKVSTLTVQGRFQAYIMSALPLVFVMFVRSFNPGYFTVLLEDHVGQIAIAIACGLWVVGMVLLVVMSKVEY